MFDKLYASAHIKVHNHNVCRFFSNLKLLPSYLSFQSDCLMSVFLCLRVSSSLVYLILKPVFSRLICSCIISGRQCKMKQESCQEKGLTLKIEQVSKSPAKKNHHAGPFLINLFFFSYLCDGAVSSLLLLYHKKRSPTLNCHFVVTSPPKDFSTSP